jgi:hypothetical protein
MDEAVAIYRQLASSTPDSHISDLAIVLHSKAMRLAGAHRPHAACTAITKAVTIYRELHTRKTSPPVWLPPWKPFLKS